MKYKEYWEVSGGRRKKRVKEFEGKRKVKQVKEGGNQNDRRRERRGKKV